jgi:putative transposase
MDMIVLAVHLNQIGLEVAAELRKNGAKPLDGVAVEYAASIFRDKDQMDVHLENAVPSMSNIVIIAHRPKV